MNPTPCWIWYPGDFEIRHALKLHARRQERDYVRPAFWPVYDCWHSARFFRHAELAAPEGLTVQARGKGNVCVDGKLYPFGKEIPLSAGSHEIMIDLCREDGLPCLYVESSSLSGTEGWMVHPFAGEKSPWVPALCSPGRSRTRRFFPLCMKKSIPWRSSGTNGERCTILAGRLSHGSFWNWKINRRFPSASANRRQKPGIRPPAC